MSIPGESSAALDRITAGVPGAASCFPGLVCTRCLFPASCRWRPFPAGAVPWVGKQSTGTAVKSAPAGWIAGRFAVQR
jgi:hypothetical protein